MTTASQNAPGGPPPYLNASLQDEDPRGPGQTFPAQPRKPPGRGQALEPGDPMVFRDLEPGRYMLEAQPQPPWYVASASCGNLDLTRDPLVIGAGIGACTVRMVYRDDSASLKWLASPAEDGSGAGNEVFVIAIPLDSCYAAGDERLPSSRIIRCRRILPRRDRSRALLPAATW